MQLKTALSEGGLDIEVNAKKITKNGIEAEISSPRVTEQKQKGLYAVKFHPIGGRLTPEMLKDIYNAIAYMDDVSLRVTPDEAMYIINCNGDEVQKVLDATDCGAKSDIEESVACIGVSICQQGLRDSQELLRNIIDAVRPHNFPSDALPQLHISGCMSSCGTHQIGSIGFHGKVKMIDKKPYPAFTININGCDRQGQEKFGEELGVMLAEDIPRFMVELGEAVTEANMSYNEFAENNAEKLTELIKKYI